MELAVRLFLVPLVVVLSSTVKDDPWPCLVYSRSEAGKSLILDNDVNTSRQHYGNSGDIIQLAKDLGLAQLVKLIDKAQLTDALKSGTFTLIGPSDEAFENIPDWFNSTIQGNSTVLKDLLRYHVIPGKLFTSSMHDGVMAISLLEGASVRFDRFNSDKLIAVTGAPILHGDNNIRPYIITRKIEYYA
ncbi:uncharacterized protein sll1735-like [Anneissia japonica]|uniref:uncharacterized protein sll1735-like n=1 Tax=Anneissia japonica TaxID=1529436 RepID=UPI0014256CC1|nr:uncharacterized protein sll1735-like [Anneissia japonica]